MSQSMTSDQVWIVNSPTAVGELMDGELVAMNLRAGNYFSSTGVGSFIWRCIEMGCSTDAIAEAVRGAYNVSASDVTPDVDAFLGELQGYGLIRADHRASARPPAAGGSTAAPYERPMLSVYTDMQDLLLLDPIHDVGNDGWPTRPASVDTPA